MSDQGAINDLFNGQNRILATQLLDIIEQLKQYHPFTVRQVYYQAVANLYIPNAINHYKRVSEVLTKLRRAELIPWSYIEDRTRRTTEKRGLSEVSDFLQWHARAAFDPNQYQRCYVQRQTIYVELIIEKDALSALVEEVANPYCTRVTIGRGQISASFTEQIARRCDDAMMKGLAPIILYLGDLDPSGVAIPKSLQSNFYEHHSLDVEVRRIALNPAQVKRYNLPETVDAAKKTDSNYKAWLREYGNQPPVELDALHPRDLMNIIKDALESTYDMSAFKYEIEKEQEERLFLKSLQADVQQFLKRQHPEHFRFL